MAKEVELYEVIYLIKPSFTQDEITAKMDYYQTFLTQQGSQVMVQNRGKRSLSYPIKGFERKSGDSMDRIESSGLKFFNDVRNGYLELADKYPRIKCIDAEKDTNTISLEIINLVKSL